MRNGKSFTFLALVACVASFGGLPPFVGGGGAEPKLVKLAFVTNNTSEFWKIAGAGIHKFEREGKVQVDLKYPSTGTAESQNQILAGPRQPGLRRHRRQRDRPQRPGAGARQGRREDEPHHGRLRRARSRSGCSTSGRTTTRPARRSAPGSSSCCRRAERSPSSSGTFAAENADAAPEGDPGRDRRAPDRDRRQARGQHRPRQGALERRGHRQRAPRSLDGRRAVELQRPGDRRRAVRARQARQGAGGRVRRGRRHAGRDRRTASFRRPSCRSRSCSAISPSKWMNDLATKGDAAKATLPADPHHRHGRRRHRQGQRRRVQGQAGRDEEPPEGSEDADPDDRS